ncbi:hypothetical protein BC833DRAFT_582416 [Globomyces pollinis-pini]|nr:hypothetical protein BC833DRAFT_582416 [Globomyces pollinis-pini]
MSNPICDFVKATIEDYSMDTKQEKHFVQMSGENNSSNQLSHLYQEFCLNEHHYWSMESQSGQNLVQAIDDPSLYGRFGINTTVPLSIDTSTSGFDFLVSPDISNTLLTPPIVSPSNRFPNFIPMDYSYPTSPTTSSASKYQRMSKEELLADKEKRRSKNAESARRSRARKLNEMQTLQRKLQESEDKCADLIDQIEKLKRKVVELGKE